MVENVPYTLITNLYQLYLIIEWEFPLHTANKRRSYNSWVTIYAIRFERISKSEMLMHLQTEIEAENKVIAKVEHDLHSSFLETTGSTVYYRKLLHFKKDQY